MATEDAPVGVELVEDHEAEPLEQTNPLGVVRQHPGVEHVRVGEHHLASLPQGTPRPRGGIPVVGEGPDLHLGCIRELPQLGELILGERLGRVHEDGGSIRVSGDGVEDRHQIAEGLA